MTQKQADQINAMSAREPMIKLPCLDPIKAPAKEGTWQDWQWIEFRNMLAEMKRDDLSRLIKLALSESATRKLEGAGRLAPSGGPKA